MLNDNKGKKCKNCKKGIYIEKFLMDDISGTLHCNKCDNKVNRYSNGYINTLKFKLKK